MADAPERSPGSPANAADPTVRLGPLPPPPEEPYRPLSGMALAGFFLAALYTLIVLGGGVLSFVVGFAWLLPGWVHVLAVAGLGLSLVARSRIRDSEGVLSGAKLAGWGIGLTTVCVAVYSAYYLATFFAVRQQASQFTERYFEHLKKNEVESAFVQTIRPPRVSEKAADLRDRLENLYNVPGPAYAPGPFTAFADSDHVRMIRMNGADAVFEPKGIRDWAHEKGGYRVSLVYRIHTPIDVADYIITVQSSENPREFAGRQWHVVREETGFLMKGQRDITPEGRGLFQTGDDAVNFAKSWLDRLEGGDRLTTYFDTLPPAERNAQKEVSADILRRSLAASAAGAGAVVAGSPAAREFRDGYRAFLGGSLLRAEAPGFWAPASLRPVVLAAAHRCFNPPSAEERAPAFGLVKSNYPHWRREGDRIKYIFGVMIKAPEQMIEGDLTVSARVADLQERRPRVWQVDSLELLRGRNVPKESANSPPR